MLKIFVTGDNHIGLKYASHEQAAALIEARISAFDEMVRIANREGCSLFVVTGDLFENTYSISKRDVKTILDKLAGFHGYVAVLPGNHDYYDKDAKVWQYFKDIMQSLDNIILLSDYRCYELTIDEETVVLYPALCTSLHSEPYQNNLGWIKRENIVPDGAYRIGIAHGSVEGETIDNEGQYFLMKRKELESIPVDAWLIGHTHVPFPRNLKTDAYTTGEKIFNAGTHVQTDVNCDTEGCCFILEIGADKVVKAKKVVSGNLRFYRRQVAVKAGEMKKTIERELADIANNSVVDIIVSGAVTEEEYESKSAILRECLAKFLEGTFDCSDLTKLITKEIIASEFPETSFSAQLLNSLLDDPKEAQLAYDLLKTLKEGK